MRFFLLLSSIIFSLFFSTQKVEAVAPYCVTVPVLMYHHIQPTKDAAQKKQSGLNVDNGMFDLQMEYLKSHGYTTITAKQLIDSLRTHVSLPKKSIVLTFDDGYKDNYTYALPIFKKYGVTANLMLATGLMEGADYLSWDQVNEMKNNGVYFTDHTWSHYGVGRGSQDKIKFEIETAKKQIEDHTGQHVDIFTYPYGSFSNAAISILQQDGFLGAFSTIPGFSQCDSFIMNLHRTRIGNAPLSAYGL